MIIPQADSVTIAPNPVNANTSFLISIAVSEIDVVIQQTILYCGDLICGEQILW